MALAGKGPKANGGGNGQEQKQQGEERVGLLGHGAARSVSYDSMASVRVCVVLFKFDIIVCVGD